MKVLVAGLGNMGLSHALAHHAQGVNIQAGVGFIQHGQFWIQHGHLDHLVPLLFATRETNIHKALQHLWLQAQVDREVGAGVSLAGTGHGNGDELRELVWQDAAAQLFVSDGQDFLESTDAPDTFEEALRLNATERFVALADFDGDGTSDWLVEDTSTRDVWIVTDEAESSLRANPDQATAQLLGHGDFDGDGRAELLWVDDDNQLLMTGTDSSAPSFDPATRTPEGFEPLAIADLDGDGADDVVGRNADGILVFAHLAAADDASESGAVPVLSIDWRSGPEDTTHSLDLVATLDIDEDGAAEIAWLNGDGDLEIWTTAGGFHLSVEP